MNAIAEPGVCQFYRIFPSAPSPRRADRSADGMLPVRGYRYCEALASASAFGWYIYPPLNFGLMWDGVEIVWTYENADAWYPLRSAHFPGFPADFDRIAPPTARDLVPGFLTAAREPGVVQIWSGYLARTAPGWSLLSRGPANIPRVQGYEHFEGIIESETWFGPLFTNIRLTHANSPIEFHTRYPLFQAQPILRQCLNDPPFDVLDASDLSEADWASFEQTMQPNADTNRRLGHYAVATRKRVRSEPD